MVVAISQCSGCASQTFEDDSYCQECGKFLRSEAAETKALKLTPRLIEQDTGDFLANLNPGSAKPVVSLPVVAGAVLLLLIPCGIYAVEHSYDSISTSYICDQAKKSLEEGKPEATIEQLDLLAMTHHGLPKPAKDILDNALINESNRLIITGNYQHARNDLKRISSEFANRKAVYARLQVCDHHLALQSADSDKTSPIADAHTSRRPAKHSTRSIFERRQSPGTTGSASISPTVATTAAKISPTAATTTAKVSPTVTTTAAKISTTVTSTNTNVAAEAPTADSKVATMASSSTTGVLAQTSTGGQPALAAVKPKKSKVAAANFSQNDVARYNALLAGYFSSRGGANGELREPLSFREWVEKDKPKF